MNRIRLQRNTNLTLLYGATYRGFPLLSKYVKHRPMIKSYLEVFYQALLNGVADYNRCLIIRFELYFTPDFKFNDNRHISWFWDCFKRCINRDVRDKELRWGRSLYCKPVYVWVKERNRSHNFHYHCFVILNHDVYQGLGSYYSQEGTVSAMIKNAWAESLGLSLLMTKGLVNFSKNGVFYLDSRKPPFRQNFDEVFYRISYMAKARTKGFRGNGKFIGSSQLVDRTESYQSELFGRTVLNTDGA